MDSQFLEISHKDQSMLGVNQHNLRAWQPDKALAKDRVCGDNEFYSDDGAKLMNGTNLHKSRHEAQFHPMFLLECILVFSTHVHQVGPEIQYIETIRFTRHITKYTILSISSHGSRSQTPSA
jgi:hypothetical protein